ncbi:MAG: hypothetical protein AB4058_17330 [Microcystaceae cyanobacterium]
MTKITEQTLTQNKDATTKEGWWHTPVTEVGNVITSLFSRSPQKEISEEVMLLHNRDMIDVRVFAKTAEAIDNDKFCKAEFLHYVRQRYSVNKGINGYEGLKDSIELLQVAIEAKDSFIAIDQTESKYRSSIQQKLYRCVEEQLAASVSKDVFHKIVFDKLEEILPKIKTEEGKKALQDYAGHLARLSENQLGLKLLSLFKTYQLADYSVLQIISQILQKLSKQDTLNEDNLLKIVKVNYPIFIKLRRIIGLSPVQSTPETYTKILNYIGLSYRHALSYHQFDQLLQVMRQWVKPYYVVDGIRKEHPPRDYTQPKEFAEQIPGLALYMKYKKSLTDRKTGMVYLDLDS